MEKVWTYTISKELTPQQLNEITAQGIEFTKNWTAHDNQLTAEFSVFKNRIIIVKANEKIYEASGCSIDKLLRFIKKLEQEFDITLLNRLLVPVKTEVGVNVFHKAEIKEKIASGQLSENSIIFNTSVSNSNELSNWEQEIKNSWLKNTLS
ncbi:MAG: hypothetical protein JSU07_05640 [Bacteroidetes bacterium]|nr:hypothetical protein [Bacteroidota bacterium]